MTTDATKGINKPHYCTNNEEFNNPHYYAKNGGGWFGSFLAFLPAAMQDSHFLCRTVRK
jgi:hypothetical protein